MQKNFKFFFLKLQLIFNNKNNKIIFLKKKKNFNIFFFLKNIFFIINYFKKNVYLVFYYNFLINFKNDYFLDLFSKKITYYEKINLCFLFFLKKNKVNKKKYLFNINKYVFFLILVEIKQNNIIFFKYFNFFKKKFLVYKKSKNFGNYWTTIVNKYHQLYETNFDVFLKLRNFWQIFEITDETTRFRLKIDDGIGNDWLFITQLPKINTYLNIKNRKKIKKKIKFLWENELLKRKSRKNFKQVEKKIKKLSLIYYKKLEPLKTLHKIRLQKVEDLKNEIYNFVINRKYSYYYNKKGKLKESIFADNKPLKKIKFQDKKIFINNLLLNKLLIKKFLKNNLLLKILILKNLKLTELSGNLSIHLFLNTLLFKNYKKKNLKISLQLNYLKINNFKFLKFFFLLKFKKKLKLFIFKKKKILNKLNLLKKIYKYRKFKKRKFKSVFFFIFKNKRYRRRKFFLHKIKKKFFLFYFILTKNIIFKKLIFLKKKIKDSFFFLLLKNKLSNLKKKNYKFFFYLTLKKKLILLKTKKLGKKKIIFDKKENIDIKLHLTNINFLCSTISYSKHKIFLFTLKNLVNNMNFFYQYQYEHWLLRIIFLNSNFWKWIKVYITNDWAFFKKKKKFFNFKLLKYSNFINPLILNKKSYKILKFINKKRKIQKIARYLLKISLIYFKKIFFNNYFIYLKKINEKFFNWKLKKAIGFFKKTLMFELLRENFIKEFIGICSSTFFIKDPRFLIKWILKILQKLYYKKHWNFLYHLQRNIKKIARIFIKYKIFTGLHLIIKGKIGAVGSVRKKVIHLKIGRYNLSNYSLKGDYLTSYAITQTGKIGLKMIICYN